MPEFTPRRRNLATLGIALVLIVAFVLPGVFGTAFGSDGGMLSVIDYEGPENPNNEWGKIGLPMSLLSDEQKQKFADITALGRWGQPEELAGPALMLASEAGSYITGTTLLIDGGAYARAL